MRHVETDPARVIHACSGACSGFERHLHPGIVIPSPIREHRSVRLSAFSRHRHMTVPFFVSVAAPLAATVASQESLEPRGPMEGTACAPSF